MVFQFEHMVMDQQEGKEKWDLAPLPFVKLKKCLAKWQNELYGKGWNSLFFDNHDLPRIVSRWGDDGAYREKSAKMLALVLHGMQGTPYVYQGEELGMTNVKFPDISYYEDIETVNMYHERMEAGYKKDDIMRSIYAKSRDNARTPFQWDDTENAGFTTGTPWIMVNPNYKEINAKDQLEREDSVFHYYQKLIRLRKEHEIIVYGSYDLLLPDDRELYVYTRTLGTEKLLVVCNFYGNTRTMELPEGWTQEGTELLIGNYGDIFCEENTVTVRPYEAFVLKMK